MRVVMVAESFLPRVNGVSGSVLRASRHLMDRGHEVHVIAPSPAPATTRDGARVHAVRSVFMRNLGVDVSYPSTALLAGILRDLSPDVVHLASPLILGHQAARAAVLLDIPTVAVFQTDITGFAEHYRLKAIRGLADAMLRRIHRDADLTLAPSTASLEYLSRIGIHRIARWGRGVDVVQFDPARRDEQLRRSWCSGRAGRSGYGACDGRVVVGFVGRLAPEKNVGHLRHLADDERVQLVVIGDGPQRSALAAQLPRARFTGMLTGADLGAAVASLDIVLAPGERETFCQVIQEAMAAAVPVVAPGTGGPRDLVRHGETGLTYPPGGLREMVDCVDALVSNSGARAAMGKRAREIVQDRTWDRIGDELIGHYRCVVNAPALARSA